MIGSILLLAAKTQVLGLLAYKGCQQPSFRAISETIGEL